MTNIVLVDAYNPDLTILACLDNGNLDNVFCESEQNSDNVGNIYLARVVNVVESLSAYFINYGVEKNGFLPFSSSPNPLKKDEYTIVQMAKNERGDKGARLTGFVKLVGKYSVFMPYGSFKYRNKSVVSRNEHHDYKAIELDLNQLKQGWTKILAASNNKVPQMLYKDHSMIKRILRDKYFNKHVEIIVDGNKCYEEIKKITLELNLDAKVTDYRSIVPIFHKYGIIREIKSLSDNKVYLPSGGSIVIDQTEAMVCVDVNSSSSDYGNLIATSHRVNLEAAEEVAKQIRMRDLSGIIAIDFIDMHSQEIISEVQNKFQECVKLDNPLIKVAPINEFCVMMLSRPRSNLNLYEYLYTKCEHCGSHGFRRTNQNIITNILHEIRLSLNGEHKKDIVVECEPKVAEHLLNNFRRALLKLEDHGSRIIIKSNDAMANVFSITPQGAYIIPKKLEQKIDKPAVRRIPYTSFPKPYLTLCDAVGQIVIQM